MKIVLLSGIAASGLFFAASSVGAADSWSKQSAASAERTMEIAANGRRPGSVTTPGAGMQRTVVRVRGPRPGFNGIPRTDIYRRPHRGFILPRYWVQPTFFVGNFRNYGLTAPTNGYRWSRYYDDAVLTDDRGYVQDYRSDIRWDDGDYSGTPDYAEPDYGPSMRPDAAAYQWNDDNVAFAAPDGSSYQYQGEWDGEFVDAEARVYEGQWNGRVIRHDGVSGLGHPAPQPHHSTPYLEPDYGYDNNDYDIPIGYENYERCLKSNGLTGGAIGAVLGGIAGNRIAGRGDRLGGTLIGAGIGGLLGVAIEKATDKCDQYRPAQYRPPVAHPYPQHPQPHPYPQSTYGHSWQSGYYYYPQPVTTTITFMPGAAVTTTTVTEEVTYETVSVAPRRKAVRKWKPKPKPRCVCR